jgi:hypothetical protein
MAVGQARTRAAEGKRFGGLGLLPAQPTAVGEISRHASQGIGQAFDIQAEDEQGAAQMMQRFFHEE